MTVRDYIAFLDSAWKKKPKRASDRYANPAEFVLLNGRQWPVPDPVIPVTLAPCAQCYNNALLLAEDDPEMTYVEGWACGGIGIPLEHAWCVNPAGFVVDPTWQRHDSKGRWMMSNDYFGVAVQTRYARRVVRGVGGRCWQVVFNWKGRWPCLHDDPVQWRVDVPAVAT